MPQAVAFVFFGTTSTAGLTAFGISIGAGTIGGAILSAAGSLLLSTAANALLADTPSPEQIKGISRSATSKRLVPLGRVQMGGTLGMEPRIDAAGNMYLLVVHGVGPIDGREKHFVDGEEVTLDANGFVQEDRFQESGDSKLQILTRSGAFPSTAYQELIDAFPDWTPDHRLDGLATTLLIMYPPSRDKLQAMFPRLADTQYSTILRGIPLRDPRTNTVAWSENAALPILDYIETKYNIPNLQVNEQEFIEAANACDNQVASKTGTEARYRVGGSYSLTETPKAVLSSLLAICDGKFTLNSAGEIGLKCGGDKTATVKLEKEHVISVVNWARGRGYGEAYNVLNANYTDQSLGFVSQPATPWVDADGLARLNARKDSQADFTLCPTWTQVTRLQQDKTINDNPIEFGRIRYDLHGLKAIGEDFIEVEIDVTPSKTISGIVRVGDFNVPSPLTYIDIDIAVLGDQLYQYSSEIYGEAPVVSTPDEANVIPEIDPVVVADGINPAKAGIGVFFGSAPNTSFTPVVEVGVDAVSGPTVFISWQDIAIPSGQEEIIWDGANTTTDYHVRTAWRDANGNIGEYSPEQIVTTTTAINQPIAPTAFSVSDDGGGVASGTITASASLNNWKTNIYRDGILIQSIATIPSEVITFTDQAGAGTYTYTAEARGLEVTNTSALISTTPTTTTVT